MSARRCTSRLVVACLLLLALSRPAAARIGANDVVPAATLLVPYFEVDRQPFGTTTTIAVVNTGAGAVLARVNLWTDQGVPSFSFYIYMTGYDMEVIDLYQLFTAGLVPSSASDGADPGDVISPQGSISQDINFSSCNGVLPAGRLDAAQRAALIAAHTGQASSLFGGLCGAVPAATRPATLRGFVTIDTVMACAKNDPTSLAYATGELSAQNVLSGFFEVRDSANNLSLADDAVHIEASASDTSTDGAGDATFYGQLFGWTGVDHREPIGPRWRASYEVGGVFDLKTNLILFRWTTSAAPFACASPPAATPARELLVFDEQENVVDATDQLTLSRVTTLLSAEGLGPFGFGYVDIDLRQPLGATDGPPADRTFVNSAVFSERTTTGRYGVGMPAMRVPVGGTP